MPPTPTSLFYSLSDYLYNPIVLLIFKNWLSDNPPETNFLFLRKSEGNSIDVLETIIASIFFARATSIIFVDLRIFFRQVKFLKKLVYICYFGSYPPELLPITSNSKSLS